MIDIKNLKESDVGRWVEWKDYSSAILKTRLGRIKSWNGTFIHVVFRCDGRWVDYQDFTAESCDSADLKFTEELPDEWKKEKCECGHQFESIDDYIMVGEVKICWGCAENNQ